MWYKALSTEKLQKLSDEIAEELQQRKNAPAALLKLCIKNGWHVTYNQKKKYATCEVRESNHPEAERLYFVWKGDECKRLQDAAWYILCRIQSEARPKQELNPRRDYVEELKRESRKWLVTEYTLQWYEEVIPYIVCTCRVGKFYMGSYMVDFKASVKAEDRETAMQLASKKVLKRLHAEDWNFTMKEDKKGREMTEVIEPLFKKNEEEKRYLTPQFAQIG